MLCKYRTVNATTFLDASVRSWPVGSIVSTWSDEVYSVKSPKGRFEIPYESVESFGRGKIFRFGWVFRRGWVTWHPVWMHPSRVTTSSREPDRPPPLCLLSSSESLGTVVGYTFRPLRGSYVGPVGRLVKHPPPLVSGSSWPEKGSPVIFPPDSLDTRYQRDLYNPNTGLTEKKKKKNSDPS